MSGSVLAFYRDIWLNVFFENLYSIGEASWTPWMWGTLRMSEITIEQSFGHLRQSQANAELSVETFVRTSALYALQKMAKAECPSNSKKVEEPALTEKQSPDCLMFQVFSTM